MSNQIPRITYDKNGTPGIWAAQEVEVYAGLGWLHGRHRSLQALLLAAGGRGILAENLLPQRDLVALDKLVHRLDLPERGKIEAGRIEGKFASWLDAYIFGFTKGLHAHGVPFELRVLATKLPPLDRSSIISGFMMAAYLGLAQGQERMERALVDALAAGADSEVLEWMFSPNLKGWDSTRLSGLPFSNAEYAKVYAGGSNAWAVEGDLSSSGKPILCGDPHLQVNQLPALFFEVRARIGNNFCLGATIPGLPGWFMGRNRFVAWSGTFACADNVDFFIENIEDGKVKRSNGFSQLLKRTTKVKRRFRSPLEVNFYLTDRGVLEGDNKDGEGLAVQWCGAYRAADMLTAYMLLPTSSSAKAAEKLIERAALYSLHLVFADTGGDVRYCQVGRIPRRTNGWSGLYPVDALSDFRWDGFYEGDALPKAMPDDGIVVSANEARLASDGGVLATLAQPSYRLDRINYLLRARQFHDVESMKSIQRDLVSNQALGLRPLFIQHLEEGPVREVLVNWDATYTATSKGAHAFELCYSAAIRALAPELGGSWFLHMLDNSELSVWWLNAIDRLLFDPMSWKGVRGERIKKALATKSNEMPQEWGQVQQFSLPNMILGGLPKFFGFDRGPFALEGSVATVRQGNLLKIGEQQIAIGPAYRMICDLNNQEIWTSLPGGVDGSRFGESYDCWLQEWLDTDYHRLAPPDDEELK